ncbi:o-succinylbenzoate synthase [Psychroflexus sp. ALD_RP9]|uniref:o-succinylbenzoate synthase n=1 Tax=Psychroflexus sp. ALD_RP9 TaxID=2777186 RepID=UPI001A8E4B14|nr:o-succinylbenzoate synthase [Psychroflexus sp. ALD_RP9]QSS97222.1 o-succinylbenzoate synthase [Psychroflexus sp. ALD_RP9]
MEASYKKYILNFKRPSGTSRGVLKTKETWFVKIEDETGFGIGECGILRGLSIDDVPEFENKLKWACENINLGLHQLCSQLKLFPSIKFGLEMAFKSLKSQKPFYLFNSNFYHHQEGITINGLIWMGDKSFMFEQIKAKLDQGFSCIKLKIGAIDFQAELDLLAYLRSKFSAEVLELRVDANGAFKPENALSKLNKLSQFKLHSIEQPIKQNQWLEMYNLCRNTPLPIALDEELIEVVDTTNRIKLLDEVKPQYIILKPSLVGGFADTSEWIKLAETRNIGWWITSALESDIGLNAIAQFASTFQLDKPQGLGTGSLYTNNITSPLEVKGEKLFYNSTLKWKTPQI